MAPWSIKTATTEEISRTLKSNGEDNMLQIRTVTYDENAAVIDSTIEQLRIRRCHNEMND